MKENILTALKAKFPGVNANVLNRIADMFAKTVKTEEEVATALEGVTQEYINMVIAYGDSRATDAQKTAIANYEQRYGLKNGIKVTDQADETNGGKTDNEPPQAGERKSTISSADFPKSSARLIHTLRLTA